MHVAFFKSVLLIISLSQVGAKEDKPEKFSDFKVKLAKSFKALPPRPAALVFDKNASISELGISVPSEDLNDTLQFDHHIYYNSTFYSDADAAKKLWIDLDSFPQAVSHLLLSDSHRQAATISLKFDFPFYGTPLKNVTIATGGFLYTGDYLHNWIAATQYIAPLMANFDTSQSNESVIKYADNGTAFIVEWDKVYIRNKMNEGAFTFQVSLFNSGDIVFAYKEVPYPIANISDANHPVKIGISDAYVLERSLFFVRRKTIYEYHKIDMLKKNISSNTALHLRALPTCMGYKDCGSCSSAQPDMECVWCKAVSRCSSGMDRLRQAWVANGCTLQVDMTCLPSNTTAKTTGDRAAETSTNSLEHHSAYDVDFPAKGGLQESAHYVQGNASMGAIATIVLFVAVLLGAAAWILYAYRFPHSRSGQFLIKYRPTQWSLRKEDGASSMSSRHLGSS